MKVWYVSPAVKHNLASAQFAYGFVRAFAKRLGLRWRVRVFIQSCKRSGCWYGHAYGRRGRGRIVCRVNHSLPVMEHREWRYRDKEAQPSHILWGAPETICFLLAHELGHIVGYGGDKAGEMACNRLAREAVDAWREVQYEHPACLI